MTEIVQDCNLVNIQSQPDAKIPYGVDKIGAEYMWNAGIEGKGIKVAVLDTGEPEHNDLNVVESANFTGDNSVKDNNGHSTHVAGTVCADGRIKGVAPKAELYIAKVLSDNGSGSERGIISALKWCMEKDIDVINMSLGSPYASQIYERVLNKVIDNGAIVVAAAGNSGYDGVDYPASFDNVIATAAIDIEREWADFSSVGEEVEICAAGFEVLSTYLNNSYARHNGTSMAAPHIAGGIALIKEHYRKQNKELSLKEIRSLLYGKAEELGSPKKYGHGIFTFEGKKIKP